MRHVALVLALVAAACSADGTFVVLELAGPAGIASVDLDVALDGRHAPVAVAVPERSHLPLTMGLEIASGSGAIRIEAMARDGQGVVVATGSAEGSVVRNQTVHMAIQFGPVEVDAGPPADVPDAAPAPDAMPTGLSCDPTTQNFGEVAPGGETVRQFIVSNFRSEPTGPLVTGVLDSAFRITSDGCKGHALKPGGDCTIEVRFRPLEPGAVHSALSVNADPGGYTGAALDGTGLEPTALVFTPPAADFSSVVQGQTSTQVLQLANKGGVSSESLELRLDGALAGDFQLDASACAGKKLGRGQTCDVSVTFAPSSSGDKSATLVVSGGGTSSALLRGTGLAPGSVVAASAVLPPTAVGSTSSTTVTVRNAGDADAVVTSLTIGGNDAADFGKAPGNTCQDATLHAGDSCSVTITFTPSSAGAKVASLTILASSGAAAAGLSGTAKADLTVSRVGMGTVRSSPPGIVCGTICAAPFTTSSVELTATPEVGWTFAGWTGRDCGTATTCTIPVIAATAVVAEFVAQTFELTVTTGGTGSGTVTSDKGGIDCGATCKATFAHGTIVTLTARPAAGSQVAGWSLAGCSGATCAVTMTEARSVVATFAPMATDVTVTVQLAGGGFGTVTPSTAAACSTSCEVVIPSGNPLTLTPAGTGGSTFGGWSGSACSASGTGPCTLSPTTDVTVTATFDPPAHLLTVEKSGTGGGTVSSPSGISCGSTCSKSYAQGASVTLTALAAPDSTFMGWSGAGCMGTGTCEVTMGGQDTTVTATFTLKPLRTLSVTISGGGTGTVSSNPTGLSCSSGTCTKAFVDGTDVMLMASPGASNMLKSWSGACGGTATCTVRMDGDKTVGAQFEPTITVTVIMHPSGSYPGAYVTSTPGGITNCTTGTCAMTVAKGTPVLLSASVSSKWGSTLCPADTKCSLNGSGDVTLDVVPGYAHMHLDIHAFGQGTGAIGGSYFSYTPFPGASAIDEDRPIGNPYQFNVYWDVPENPGNSQWTGDFSGCGYSQLCSFDFRSRKVGGVNLTDI